MCKYIVLRKGTYHFQLRVPEDLQDVIGQKSIRQSLKTGDKRTASKMAKEIAEGCWSYWKKLRTTETQGIDQNVLKRHLRALLDRLQDEDRAKRVPKRWATSGPIVDMLAQFPVVDPQPTEAAQCEVFLDVLETDVATGDNYLVRDTAAQIIKESGLNVREGSPEYDRLAYEVGQVLIATEEIAIERAKGNRAKARALLMTAQADYPNPPEPAPSQETSAESEDVHYIADLIPEYLESRVHPPKGVKPIAPRSLTKFTDDLKHFVEIAGNLALHELTHKVVADFRDTLTKLPPAWNRDHSDKTIKELVAMKLPNTLGASTINDKLGTLSGFFKWCIGKGLMDVNYAKDKRLPAIEHDRNVYQPFTKNDLEIIFNAKGYRKDTFLHPWMFWIPLLGLFTGVRQSPLAEMLCDDLKQTEDGIWYIHIEKDKTKSGKRDVPLHPVLVEELNFPAFVTSVRKAKHEHVFHTLSPKKLGQQLSYGQTVSEWFNQRFLKGLPLSPPEEGRKKRFHSFRATAINAAKQAGADVRMVEETFGHADSTGTRKSSMSFDEYADAYKIRTRYEMVICKVDFGLNVGHLATSTHLKVEQN